MIRPGRQPPLPAERLSVFQACSFFNTWKFFNFLIYQNQRFLEITDCDLYFYLGNHLFVNYECYLLVKNIQLWACFIAWKKLTMNSFHFYVFFPLYDIFPRGNFCSELCVCDCFVFVYANSLLQNLHSLMFHFS